MAKASANYMNMLSDTSLPWCWACGRDDRERPRNWGGDWHIQRSHVSAGSGRLLRIEERWYVILLCPRCHLLHRHNHSEVRLCGDVFHTLTDANALWLKIERDPQWWSRERISKAWLGAPPSPESPHEWFLSEYESRRGVNAW